MKRLIIVLLISGLFGGSLHAQEYLDMMMDPQGHNFYEIQAAANEYFATRDKGRGSGYKQYKRWEEFMEPRVYPTGELINPAAKAWQNYHQYKDSDVGKSASRAVHTGYWSNMGPEDHVLGAGWNGGVGRVNTVAFHPTNANTFYVGTPAGGMWRTTDGGSSWASLTDGLPIIGVSGIAVDPNDTDIMYILTGDGDGGDTRSIGVLKTVNGGQTWMSTGLSWTVTQQVRGYKLLMHPDSSEVLYVATNAGIFKTSNGAANWTTVSGNFTFDLEFKPGDPSVLYGSGFNNFFRSTNWGNSFSTTQTWTDVAGCDRIAIGVSPADASYVYLLHGGGSVFRGLYRSTNSGASFTTRSNTPNILGYPTDGSDSTTQSCYDLAIAVNPTNINEVHTGGINCWKSTDGGQTWGITSFWREDNASFEYTHADIHALVYNGSNLYCGSDGGIFLSTDNAANWSDLSAGLAITQFYRIAGYPADPDLIYGGTQDNGCNRWDDNTEVFTHVRGADGFECIIDYTNSSIVYTERQNGIMERSTNGAATFSGISPPGQSGNGAWITPYIMDPSDPTILFAGYTDVWRTTNSGSGWASMNNPSGRLHQSLIQGISNRNRLYAASDSIIRRCDNALDANPTWTNITSGLPVAQAAMTYIAIDPDDSRRIWVTFSGYVAGQKVYESVDSGATWTNISGSLPNLPVNCIIYETGSDDGLYVGTDVGVYYRDDVLGDWLPFMNGMANVIVRELEIHYGAGLIRAGSYGRGLWESELYSNCPTSYFLTDANSPSPTGFKYYEASRSITSTRTIQGGIGTDVTYQAGVNITLSPGFHAQKYNTFLATIAPCKKAGTLGSSKVTGTYEGPMQGVVEQTGGSSLAEEEGNMDVYPNPLEEKAVVKFELAETGPVTLSVYDVMGKALYRLIDNTGFDKGTYKTTFQTADLAAGIYYCTLESNGKRVVKRLIKMEQN